MSLYHWNPTLHGPETCDELISCEYGDLDTEHYDSAAEVPVYLIRKGAHVRVAGTTEVLEVCDTGDYWMVGQFDAVDANGTHWAMRPEGLEVLHTSGPLEKLKTGAS